MFIASHSLRRLATVLGLLLAVAPDHLNASDIPKSIVNKVRRASVEIHTQGQLRGGGAFVHDRVGTPYVVTAAHLFHSPKDTCTIITEDDRSHFASLTAYDLGHDLALLEVDPKLQRYGTLSLASSIPTETKPIFNFAPALRRRTLVLPGTVADSRISYTDFSSSRGSISHFFASGINPVLSSGGIWVNQAGAIVGVQHGRLIGDQGAPSSGLSMVSPPSAIAALLESRAVAKTPGLGAYFWEAWTSERNLLDRLPKGIEGLVIDPVFENRPLARAGAKRYDVIVSCDGEPVRRRHQLLDQVRAKPAGTPFVLEIVTPGSPQRKQIQVFTDTLEEHWK